LHCVHLLLFYYTHPTSKENKNNELKQAFVYVDGVNLLGGGEYKWIKNNEQTVLQAGKEIGLELLIHLHVDKTVYQNTT